MITHHIRNATLVVLGTVALAACGGRHVPPAQLGGDIQYQRGMEAFEAGRHGRAVEFLQPFVLQNVGDPRLPTALHTLAQAHAGRREFVAAASEYQRLVTEFPTHALALPARLGTCEAYAQLSPRPQLDQDYTVAALQHCQAIIANFAGTPEAEQAQARMSELRYRLAQKEYETGMFYFRRRAFDASVIYFRRTVEEYADTSFAPAALLRMHEAFTRIGFVEDAQETRERLLAEFPNSPEARGLRG